MELGKSPAWTDSVERLPAGCHRLLHSEFCQLNLTFLLEHFMADIFLGQTQGSETVRGGGTQ